MLASTPRYCHPRGSEQRWIARRRQRHIQGTHAGQSRACSRQVALGPPRGNMVPATSIRHAIGLALVSNLLIIAHPPFTTAPVRPLKAPQPVFMSRAFKVASSCRDMTYVVLSLSMSLKKRSSLTPELELTLDWITNSRLIETSLN